MSINELDITKNIRTIEMLKSQLLLKVADLFANLTEVSEESQRQRPDILADIVIINYLLSQRLGIQHSSLDIKVINKIKMELLDEKSGQNWQQDLKSLLRHFSDK